MVFVKEKKYKNIEMSKSEKIKKVKEIVEVCSFFIQNCHKGFLPTKEGDYVYFLRTGLKGIEEKFPPDFLKQEEFRKFGKNTKFVRVGGEEKLKVKSELIKITNNLSVGKEEIGKKIALFLDKEVISLLQVPCSEFSEIMDRHLIDKLRIDKYYKLKPLLELSIGSLKHDSRCTKKSGFIEARDLVFLINPKARPKKLLSWLYEENKKWYKQENVLRHIVKSGTSDDPGSRSIATCSLVPSDVMFIAYEYNSLWLWFDVKSIEEEEKSVSIMINYCAKVAKKCVFFYPFGKN